jgi:hypothetical protein
MQLLTRRHATPILTYIQNTEQHTSITNTATNNNMYHAHDELQKTPPPRGLEMYWAYAGRTNNNNKFSPSEMLTILASAEPDEDTNSNLV